MPQFRPRATQLARRLRNNSTDAERTLWRALSRRQLNCHKFSRQIPIGPYVCDFVCRELKLIIEVDGGQHCDNAKDLARTASLEREGYRLIRFWNNDVMENLEGVLRAIESGIAECPPPSPSRLREGVL